MNSTKLVTTEKYPTWGARIKIIVAYDWINWINDRGNMSDRDRLISNNEIGTDIMISKWIYIL